MSMQVWAVIFRTWATIASNIACCSGESMPFKNVMGSKLSGKVVVSVKDADAESKADVACPAAVSVSLPAL